MSVSGELKNAAPVGASTLTCGAPLESILRTGELYRRPSRAPDYENENRALVALVSVLANEPEIILQTLADKVLEILSADSAGLSLLTDDGKRFYWAAIAGAWRPHIGGGTPRDFGPCGDVLDHNVPLLFTHWEQRYPYLQDATPLADEGLLVPFFVDGKSVGTIWAIAHTDIKKFDSEDLRLLESMGRFASAAYQAVQSIEILKLEIAARNKAEQELHASADSLERMVEARTEELQRSEAFLAEGQRLSDTGSFLWRVATDEIKWSEQLYRIFELEPGVPITLERIESLVHPEDVALFEQEIDRARRTGRNYEHDLRLQFPDRSAKYLHVVAHATRDKEGQVEYIGAIRDMTQRRLSEAALSKVQWELAHMARLTNLGELTASIAHELNQPIGAVRNNAHAALRFLTADPLDLAEVKEAIECVVSQTYRAGGIISRIRDQIEKVPPRKDAVDLNGAIVEALLIVEGELTKHRVSVVTRLKHGLPLTYADRVQLQQVIINLVLNVIEAVDSAEDGVREVVISTESDAAGNQLVAIADSGLGIASQDRERIFESFYTTKDGGVGIGLSICRSIVDSHGGVLWADANQPRGAVFKFMLPAHN